MTSNNQKFITSDSQNINYYLQRFEDKFNLYKNQYLPGSSFVLFESVRRNAKAYVDSITENNHITKIRSLCKTDDNVLYAFKAFFNAKLAHFYVLPILYKNRYPPDYLTELIKLIKPEFTYITQLQSGRVFLKTYFTKYVLIQNNGNLQKALKSSNLFLNKDIRKLLSYSYFKNTLTKIDDGFIAAKFHTEYKNFLIEFSFKPDEKKILTELNKKFDYKNQDITEFFSTQKLLDINGKELSYSDKKNLLNSNVIIDYWATWCSPCIEKISQLTSDTKILNGKSYKIIFISVDKDQNEWLSKKLSIFNKNNSFRISDFKTPSFYTAFEIIQIPRSFVFENGKLLSDNLDY